MCNKHHTEPRLEFWSLQCRPCQVVGVSKAVSRSTTWLRSGSEHEQN